MSRVCPVDKSVDNFDKHWTNTGHFLDKGWTNTGQNSFLWTKCGQSLDIEKDWTNHGQTLDNVWTWTNVGQSLYLRFYGSFDGQSLDKP